MDVEGFYKTFWNITLQPPPVIAPFVQNVFATPLKPLEIRDWNFSMSLFGLKNFSIYSYQKDHKAVTFPKRFLILFLKLTIFEQDMRKTSDHWKVYLSQSKWDKVKGQGNKKNQSD